MLLVETVLRDSGIHGVGCFANEFIPKGTRVFRFNRRVDRCFWESRLSRYPKTFERFVRFHGYNVRWFGIRMIVLPGDNDRHMNHSNTPNVVENHAARDIEVGEELTCDYWWMDEADAPFKQKQGELQEQSGANTSQVSV